MLYLCAMRVIFIFLLVYCVACSKESSSLDGRVVGTITDTNGQPLSGVKVIIDNSIFFNSNLSSSSNAQGQYSIAISNGSWYAFAVYEKVYHNRKFKLYLHPDKEEGFTGEGAKRDFQWKLTGHKAHPLSGYYGGLVTIDNYPGVYIDAKEIEFTFTPEGPLIDGSVGATHVRKAVDGHQIQDIPIGQYRVHASYNGQRLRLRQWNTDAAFAPQILLDFVPQIDGQCDNCFKLEYNQ